VATSIGLGVGFTKMGQSIKHPRWGPLVAGWAGFAGCVGAGCASLLLMRKDELYNGVNVSDANGLVHGKSKVAAQEGIAKCCVSRVVWNIPATGMTPLILLKWHATPACIALPMPAKLAVDTVIISIGLVVGLFPGQALFSQNASVPLDRIEPEFRGCLTEKGEPVTEFFYNKGL